MRFAHVSYNGILKPDITSITKAVSTCAVDGTDTLDITTLDGGVEKNDRILYLDGKGLWHEYIVQSVETQRDEGKPVTTAYCVNSIAELGSVYILDKRGRKTTAPERAKVALEGTRWNVGNVENGTIRHYTDLNFYHQSVLKSLQDITKAYGLELETSVSVVNGKVTARTVNLLEQRGNKNTERRFEYGCDLKSVKRTLMAEQVITRLYVWGKGEEKTDDDGNAAGGYSRRIGIKEVNDGKPYLDNVEAQQYWGVLEGDAVFDDCTDRNELLRLAKARLAQVSKPQVSYEADVVNLGRAGFDAHGVSVGDSVQIVDTTFTPSIRVEGCVLKIEEDLLDSVDATRITLGNISESYTQKRRAQEQKLDALISQSDEWNAVTEGNGLYVRDLIGRVNEIMNGVGGYVYLKPGIGIIIYDKPENQHPTRAIQLGGGFWRTANSRKSNGDWDWKNIASGEGIFANAITTGRLMDAAGRNFWDMDTGEFSLQSTVRIGDRTVQQIADSAAKSAASSVSSDLTEVFNQRMREELTQRAIFNKLTNNGETQGIYMSGGKLYLNAEYMSTGVLSDAAGLNRWNLRTGEFSLQSTVRIGDQTVQDIANNAASEAKNSMSNMLYNVNQSALRAQTKADTAQATAEMLQNRLNESFTQESIFNKLTHNGETQGIYLSNGHLYLNASYLRTGVIAGGYGKWDLNSGIISMWDTAGNETVHLDGNGGHNMLTGTFQTSEAGRRISISPNFNATQAETGIKDYGIGIAFYSKNNYDHPGFISYFDTNDNDVPNSQICVMGGSSSDASPTAQLKLGMDATNSYKQGRVGLFAYARTTDAWKGGDHCAGFGAGASPHSYSQPTYVSALATDTNGTVGMRATINNGALQLGGFLKGIEGGRSTVFAKNFPIVDSGMGSRQHVTTKVYVDEPARYGKYYAVATADTWWGAVNAHVMECGNADGWKCGVENLVATDFNGTVYCNTIGWLSDGQ